MHRFYLPPEQCRGEVLVLSEPDAHHASHVLRLRPGEEATILDGAGARLLCRLEQVDRHAVTARIIEKQHAPALPFTLTVVQAIPKGKIIESIIQKGTELGAARIVPLLAERVVTQLSNGSAAQKQTKWQSVAIEAIKQCGAAWLPKVDAPVTPHEFLARAEKFDLALIGSLQPGSKHPKEFFKTYEASEHRRPRTICVWIGPEGDFTPAEVQTVISAGAHPITLGPLVLRVETAAIYCMSMVNYELQAA